MKYSWSKNPARRNGYNVSHTTLPRHHWSAVLEYLLESTVVNSMFCTVNSYFNSELYPTICPKIQCSPNFYHYLNSTATRQLLTNDIQMKLYFQSVALTLQYSLYRFNPFDLYFVFQSLFYKIYWSCQLFVYTAIYINIWKFVIEL